MAKPIVVPPSDSDNSKLENSGAFITPDGRVWPCHSGEHGFSATEIIARIGLEAARGSLVIWPSGMWAQEGATNEVTSRQYESLRILAMFPPCGIKTAADAMLDHFGKLSNAARSAQSAQQEARYGFVNGLENAEVRS